ncbi:MAG TPA: LysR family transcriptional regulator [Phenylobacterium sp.]|nr:LysR family transcriptional regulator [Phenylobacterium sp.]
MDSEGLKTFVAVHRAGGFSSAAEVLGRSQPAISRRIAQLEDDLQAPLFERAAGGVVLSQAGRVLLPRAERVLAALQDASQAIAALRSGQGGPVALAAVGTLASTGLTGALKAFAERFAKVELSLQTATSAEVSDLVRRGDVTVGLRYLMDASPDLVCERIGVERLAVAAPPGHRLAGRRVASLLELKDEPWFAFADVDRRAEPSARNIFAQFLLRGVGDLRWTPVDSLTAQKRLVEAGFGLALMPVSATAEERAAGSLALIEVDDLDAATIVTLVVRKGGYLSPAALDLCERLRAEPFFAAS